jgi:hypothetical protein
MQLQLATVNTHRTLFGYCSWASRALVQLDVTYNYNTGVKPPAGTFIGTVAGRLVDDSFASTPFFIDNYDHPKQPPGPNPYRPYAVCQQDAGSDAALRAAAPACPIFANPVAQASLAAGLAVTILSMDGPIAGTIEDPVPSKILYQKPFPPEMQMIDVLLLRVSGSPRANNRLGCPVVLASNNTQVVGMLVNWERLVLPPGTPTYFHAHCVPAYTFQFS